MYGWCVRNIRGASFTVAVDDAELFYVFHTIRENHAQRAPGRPGYDDPASALSVITRR